MKQSPESRRPGPGLQDEIIPPPREELSRLYELARVGDLIGLRERLQELTISTPQLALFETRIFQLANELQIG